MGAAALLAGTVGIVHAQTFPVRLCTGAVGVCDNLGGDTARAVSMLEADILPVVQYFAYIEIATPGMARMAVSDLWQGYEALARQAPSLALRRVSERHDIFPVFRDLFAKRVLAS